MGCLCCFHTTVARVVATETAWPQSQRCLSSDPFQESFADLWLQEQYDPCSVRPTPGSCSGVRFPECPWCVEAGGSLSKLGFLLGRGKQSWMLGRPPLVPTTPNGKLRLAFDFCMERSWWSPSGSLYSLSKWQFLLRHCNLSTQRHNTWILLYVCDATQDPCFLGPSITFCRHPSYFTVACGMHILQNFQPIPCHSFHPPFLSPPPYI